MRTASESHARPRPQRPFLLLDLCNLLRCVNQCLLQRRHQASLSQTSNPDNLCSLWQTSTNLILIKTLLSHLRSPTCVKLQDVTFTVKFSFLLSNRASLFRYNTQFTQSQRCLRVSCLDNYYIHVYGTPFATHPTHLANLRNV